MRIGWIAHTHSSSMHSQIDKQRNKGDQEAHSKDD